MKHSYLRWLPAVVCGGLLAVTAAGCQKPYTAPAGDFSYDSFSERERSKADTILRSINTLSLADAQKIALLNNPNYIAAYHSVNAAKMRYYQSFASYSPTVALKAGLQGSINDVTSQYNYGNPQTDYYRNASFGVSASWLLFDGLSREFGVMAAKHNYSSSIALNDDARRQLLLAVAQAYYDILLANENRRIALEDMSFQLKNLRETEIKHQYGAVPLSDVLNFQIQVNQADSNRLTAEYNYSTALYTLAALMGYPEGTIPDAIKFPEIKYESESLLLGVDTYLDMALANRPDLKAYREQLKISEYQLYQTYSAFSPMVRAFGEYTLNANKDYYHGYNAGYNRRYDNQVLNYGLSAEWVLFNGFQRYNATREAQANMAIADFTVAQAWLNVVNDVRTAYANYDVNIKQANLYFAIRKLVFEQRDLVQAEYDAGQAEIVRLNEAQRNVVSAEGTLVQALANVQKARAQLEAAANINNLGRGFEKVSGAEATLYVLDNNGMTPNVTGIADPAEVEKYLLLDQGTEAALEKVEKFKVDPEIVVESAPAKPTSKAEAKAAPKAEAKPAPKDFVGPVKQKK
ncbi:MAG: TolC family protein [Lentisphaerae bacterium]|nr:TolC family protein [Lentisphaerota bacterium]